MGKTAVFVLACLQNLELSKSAGAPNGMQTGDARDVVAEAVQVLVVCHTRELAWGI